MSINRPPLTGNPALDSWADEVTRELSLSSASNVAPSSRIVGGGGDSNINSATLTLFKRYTAATLPPSEDIAVSCTYRFSTTTLTNDSTASTTDFDGWSRSIPSTGGDWIYTIIVNIASATDYEVIDSADWSTPELYGEPGVDGERGAGRWNIPVSSLPTNSAGADSEWDSWVNKPGDPVDKDQAWFYTGTESAPTGQSVWIYTLGTDTWTEQTEVTDGDLIIDDTVNTPKLVDESTTAARSGFGNYSAKTVSRPTNFNTLVTGTDYLVVNALLEEYTGGDTLILVNITGKGTGTNPLDMKLYVEETGTGTLTLLRSFTLGLVADLGAAATDINEPVTLTHVFNDPTEIGNELDFILTVSEPSSSTNYGDVSYPTIWVQEVKK